MYRRFLGKLGGGIAIAALAAVLGGCVQATRHSNTMYFGTNTTFGIKAGASAGEVPQVVVGYDRQEAVVMPLLANTADVSTGKDDTRNRLVPCDATRPLEVSGATYAVHPCSFVAFRDKAQDSYSVIASFGADFGGKANTNVEVSGGLAQYFATGMAAQMLAAKGGAALVSTGKAAQESARTPADEAIAAIATGSSDFAVGSGKRFDENLVGLRSRIRDTTDNALRRRKMQGFFDNLKPQLPATFSDPVLAACATSADACVAGVNTNSAILMGADNFSESVASWENY